jgi:hypothetical protein
MCCNLTSANPSAPQCQLLGVPIQPEDAGLPIYNDAIGWEIERYKADIFERLKPKLLADLNVDANERVGRLSCLVTHIASD